MAKWIVEDADSLVVFVGETEQEAQDYKTQCSSAYVKQPFVLFYNGDEIEVGDSFSFSHLLIKGE